MPFLKNELSIPPNLPLTEPSGKKNYYNLKHQSKNPKVKSPT